MSQPPSDPWSDLWNNANLNPVDFASDQAYNQLMSEMGLSNSDPMFCNQPEVGNEPEEYKFSDENPYFEQQNLEETAKDLSTKMRIKDAILACEADLIQNPSHVGSWKLLGQLQQESDSDSKATYCFVKALQIDPNNFDAMITLAISYINDCEQKKCLETLVNFLKSNSKYSNLSTGLDQNSSIDEIKLAFEQAHEAEPQDTHVISALGVIGFCESNFAKAGEYFKKAVLIHPNNYSYWNKLGASLANSGNPELAKVCYNAALSIRPHLARSWTNLGVAFFSSGEHTQAIVPYLNAMKLTSDTQHLWSYLNLCAMQTGNQNLQTKINGMDLQGICEEYDVIDADNLPAADYSMIPTYLAQIQ